MVKSVVISHRAFRNGHDPDRENRIEAIKDVIARGFDCEIDIIKKGPKLYLGHDTIQESISTSFLEEFSNSLFVHCKNLSSLDYLITNNKLRIFWHQKDSYTLVSNCSVIWTFPGEITTNKCARVILGKPTQFSLQKEIWGYCTDYPILLSEILNKHD